MVNLTHALDFYLSEKLPKYLSKTSRTGEPGKRLGWNSFLIWTPVLVPMSRYTYLKIKD